MLATKVQRGVIRFLAAEGIGVREVHRQMKTVYGEHSLSLTRVLDWYKHFLEGRESLKDDSRPGQSHLIITDSLVNEVDQITRANNNKRHQRGDGWEFQFCSYHHYRKLSAQWVPHNLRLGLSSQHLLRYCAEDNFSERVVAGDEYWCYHYQPESKYEKISQSQTINGD
ncbi:uncharacterized protein CDAR_524261 [Caerostris darwini]|uniref:Mos1 transposase HTH domain-containing protein n=1 Tax=Caerostris darwini TaxID=1538125 RepID=A0AAV4NXR3_9ARAC|nr:uncharacterized protein CDAR_524261 [Caerostris darwini]